LRKAYALLVYAEMRLGRRDQALETCRRGRGLFPKDIELRFREGVLLHEMGRFAEAKRSYLDVLGNGDDRHFSSVDRGLNGFKAHQNLAVVTTEMGDLAEAERHWREVVREAPGYRPGWRGLAETLIGRAQFADAGALAEELVRNGPHRVEGLLLKSRVAVTLGRFDEARVELDRAIVEGPDDLETLRARCQFLFEHGRTDEAEEALKSLIAHDPQDASAYHNLGTLLLRTARHDEAVQAYRQSLRFRLNHPATYVSLGYALKDSGRMEEAAGAWEQALRLAPNDPIARSELSRQGRGAAGQDAALQQVANLRRPQIAFMSSTTDGSSGSRHSDAPARAPSLSLDQENKDPETQSQSGCGSSDQSNGTFALALEGTSGVSGQLGSDVDLPQSSGLNLESQDRRPEMTDEWRRWIAENLMVGQPADTILATMRTSGFAEAESANEVSLAMQSPYFRGSELVRNRLKKRDWLLSLYRKLHRLHPQAGEIERRAKLTRQEFLVEYYSANRPVIITGMMDDWPAMRKWNLDYFAQNFGDRVIEVQMGRTLNANFEIERRKHISTLKFGDFVEKVRSAGETNDFYMTANNTTSNRKVLPELWNDIRQFPEYLDPERPGSFFWMGPAGTITPFHHDLTNNFMAQVIGRKRVKIAPSWDLPVMRNHFYCYSQVDGCVTPHTPHPRFQEPQILECILDAGEILFLPIGCLHFVQ
jgi:tetratricopeptide (TPR) repeat protein